MEAIQLSLNDQLVTVTADSNTVDRLYEDDRYLADFIKEAAKTGQFDFLFAEDSTQNRIFVKRIPTAVWCKKSRPRIDAAASLLLVKLCNERATKFNDDSTMKTEIWNEIANEMRSAGYDVDGRRCCTKYLQIARNNEKMRCREESSVRLKKRKVTDEDEKKSFGELHELVKRRNELYEENLKQNREVIEIMEKLLK